MLVHRGAQSPEPVHDRVELGPGGVRRPVPRAGRAEPGVHGPGEIGRRVRDGGQHGVEAPVALVAGARQHPVGALAGEGPVESPGRSGRPVEAQLLQHARP
ncbi:hypothetical protein H488_0108480 [Kocuria sp. UCD-OTCP]|nr:hypothetical protein H488_0108480 [Kocuria sp. UCD-OTCP]